MDIHFKSTDLDLLCFVLEQNIASRDEILKIKKFRLEERIMKDRHRSEMRLQRQRSELFHVFTLGVFMDLYDPEQERMTRLFGEMRINRYQKGIIKLHSLLSAAKTARNLGNHIYMRVEDIEDINFDYWKEQWEKTHANNPGLILE